MICSTSVNRDQSLWRSSARSHCLWVNARWYTNAKNIRSNPKILIHTTQQGIQGIKRFHRSNTTHEHNRYVLSVEIQVASAQNMRFNSAYFTVKLRICPHRNRSGKELCRTAVPDMPDKPSSVDAITWNDTFNVIA